jgi:hypothetical protein
MGIALLYFYGIFGYGLYVVKLILQGCDNGVQQSKLLGFWTSTPSGAGHDVECVRRYATSRKVAGSSPDTIIEYFNFT